MIVVYIDGLCEPVNPGGIATYGLVIRDDQNTVIARKKGLVGEGSGMSNNVAEYAALCEALRSLLKGQMAASHIEVRSDSRLVVNQMKGDWKFHKGLYGEKYREARDLVTPFTQIEFKWIPREQNEEADLLSREAYSEATATMNNR